MIFYFTGTGNSLYVAQKIADKLGEQIYSIAEYQIGGQIGEKGEKVGFVFPSYYGNLPRIVRNFINSLDIHPDTYIWGVVTMGAFTGVGSISALQKALSEKNLDLKYGCGISMPANYIIKYNPMFLGKTAKSGKKIERIVDDINSNKMLIKKNSIISENLYKNIEELDKAFYVESHCSGCGFCEQICPVNNIRITDSRPQWLHRCEHCVACIHRCPKQAIQYGTKTKKRRRYYNSEV